ncbi:MAG: PQQ-dependent sugar dehydrogenase, partial [Verrucomicrobia bacterium]|nr:PQQ-dependent sugar dehydrogenase [Verrucomicrobiota bacterium]
MNPMSLVRMAWTALVCLSAAAMEVPADFQVETLVADLYQPVALSVARDGRIFLAEQSGVVRVWEAGRVLRWNPYTTHIDRQFWYVYANGVRNPSGLAVQPPWEGGRVFFTDGGGNDPEEVNELISGSDYGSSANGPSAFGAPFREPLYAYRTDARPAIVGGA